MIAAARLGLVMWLLFVAACRGQNQPSGATQSPASTSVPTAGQSSSPAPVSKQAAAAPSPSAAAATRNWNFDADPAGDIPTGAQIFSGQWAVRAESDAPSPPNALCQTGQADFPAIGLDPGPHADLTLVTKFKSISGKQDQAGGLIFRVQDKDNYYIVRGNALEDNVIFFTYVGGQRSQLKGAGAKVASGVWHQLRVDVRGNSFVAFLDGTRVVDVTDDRYTSGGIGLWTKSDSVTCFDDVELTVPE
jgi:Laminin G domain